MLREEERWLPNILEDIYVNDVFFELTEHTNPPIRSVLKAKMSDYLFIVEMRKAEQWLKK
jgi:hypothetical protein